jgi:metal-responsive CopG/Arc/MetJ family transcriptional regulator
MPKTKVTLTLETDLLAEVDSLVRKSRFVNRSQAVEAVIAEQLARLRRTRLPEACALLDPDEERMLAEEQFVATRWQKRCPR